MDGSRNVTKTAQQDARLALVAAAAASLIVLVVPILRPLAYPVELFGTLVHELGHGVAAILTGGRFDRLRVWPDGSGLADVRVGIAAWKQAATAAGGLLGPPAAAMILFVLSRSRRGARIGLMVLAAVLTLALALFVRNVFGAILTLLIIAGCVLAARIRGREVPRLVALLVAVQLALSVFVRAGDLFSARAVTAAGTMTSDVGQIAEAFGGPAWLWGGLVSLISAAIVIWGLGRLWGDD